MTSAYIIANLTVFDASAEYRRARTARQGAAVMRMVLVEGV